MQPFELTTRSLKFYAKSDWHCVARWKRCDLILFFPRTLDLSLCYYHKFKSMAIAYSLKMTIKEVSKIELSTVASYLAKEKMHRIKGRHCCLKKDHFQFARILA